MPHDDLERLGGYTGVDESLSTTTAKIVGTGVLLTALAIFAVNRPHNDARLLANFADDFSHVVRCQSVFDLTTVRAIPRRSTFQLFNLCIGNGLA